MITLVDVLHKEYSEIIGIDQGHRQSETIRRWLESAQCPNEKCHAIGQFNNHGYYTRGFEDLATTADNHDSTLTVLRGKCKSCETTHAFLPADAIPYRWPLVICFLITMKEKFHQSGESTAGGSAQDTKHNPEIQSQSLQDKEGYHYKGPFTLRMAYRNLELLEYYLKYLQDTIRDLQLWEKAQQPGLWEAVKILLSGDIRIFQRRTLELHHKPLFFRRERTKTRIPHIGMLKTG